MTAADGHINQQDDKCKATVALLVFFVTFPGLVILFIYLAATSFPGPSPDFILHDVKLRAFNFSTPNLNVQVPSVSSLTSTLQITISCRNPSQNIFGIHFDKVDVYASYKNQQIITLPTMIQPSYLGHPGAAVWSLYLNGTNVQVPPQLAASIAQDVTAGTVPINVKITGRLRYKNVQGLKIRYRMEVNCPAYLTLPDNFEHQIVDGCHTHVHV